MPVSIEELATCAAEYSSNALTEAQIRTCISRAYYAAYHASSAYHQGLASQGHLPANASYGFHEQLVQQLTKPSVGRAGPAFLRSKSIGYMLASLRKVRVRADYELFATLSSAEANQVLADVQLLIEKSGRNA